MKVMRKVEEEEEEDECEEVRWREGKWGKKRIERVRKGMRLWKDLRGDGAGMRKEDRKG